MTGKKPPRGGLRARVANREGQNVTEFMLVLVFCFGLGAATFGLFGTQSTGMSSTKTGECVDDSAIGAAPRTFDAGLITNPTMSAPGVVDSVCLSKPNLPARVAQVYEARSKYTVLPIP